MAERRAIYYHRISMKALKSIGRANKKLTRVFKEEIEALSLDPFPSSVTILKERDAYSLCRIRIRKQWRLFYGVSKEALVIIVLDVASREGAYDDKKVELLDNRLWDYLEQLLDEDDGEKTT